MEAGRTLSSEAPPLSPAPVWWASYSARQYLPAPGRGCGAPGRNVASPVVDGSSCPGPARQSPTCCTQVCRGEHRPRPCLGTPTSLLIPILAFNPDSQVAF